MAASSDRLQHQIAANAAAFVAEIRKGASGGPATEYKAFCEGFPTLLRSAGLLQTLLFLEAKKAHPHGTLLKHLKEQFQGLGMAGSGSDLSVTVAGLGTAEYMTWTRIADKVAYWNKRFCQALLIEKS